MKTLLRWVVALTLLLTAGAASAQSLAGNWQGTLQAGQRALRRRRVWPAIGRARCRPVTGRCGLSSW